MKEPDDVRKCYLKLRWKWILGIMGVVAGVAYGIAALVRAYAQASWHAWYIRTRSSTYNRLVRRSCSRCPGICDWLGH